MADEVFILVFSKKSVFSAKINTKKHAPYEKDWIGFLVSVTSSASIGSIAFFFQISSAFWRAIIDCWRISQTVFDNLQIREQRVAA
jgi:hypothetical protein